MSSSPELHALLFPPGPRVRDRIAAALNGGPAVALLDPSLPARRLQRLLDVIRPHRVIDSDELRVLPLLGQPPTPVSDDTSLVICTSGSSGEPKVVELSRSAVAWSAQATLDYLGADENDGWLCCLPTWHIAGAQVIIRSLLTNSPLEIQSRFDVEAVSRSRAAFVSMVPTMLHRCLETKVDLSRFSAILLGGAGTSSALLTRAHQAGARVVTTYGMTETAGGCVYDGVPLQGVRVHLEDRIVLDGPMLASGYRNNPAATAEAFTPSGFLTSDLGEWTPDGKLHILGRVDDVIVTGGVKVHAEAIANTLRELPGVRDAFVYGADDPEWGQRVVAVIESDGSEVDGKIRTHVASSLGKAAAPKTVRFVEALPRFPNGKVDRTQLHATPREHS